MGADVAEPAGQAVHQHGVQQHLHLHVGAVPHDGAPPAARLLLHGGPRRQHRRAADAAPGRFTPSRSVCLYRLLLPHKNFKLDGCCSVMSKSPPHVWSMDYSYQPPLNFKRHL